VVVAAVPHHSAWLGPAVRALNGIQLMVLAVVAALVAMTLLLPPVLWELMVGTTVEVEALRRGWERREELVVLA
jgi:hypothetical protein